MSEPIHETTTTSGSAPAETTRRARPRTCVGCGEPDARSAVIRLVLGPEGVVAVDLSDGGFGRGAHVHPRPDCLARAAAGGLARAAKSAVRIVDADDVLQPVSAAALSNAIAMAAHRRFAGLLATAKRAKHAALGARAVEAACREGSAKLVIVATDAAASADLGEVRRAVAEGRAVAWGTKRQLAEVLRPRAASKQSPERNSVEVPLADPDRTEPDEGIAVVAVTEDRLAAALKETMVTVDACAATRDARPGARKPSRGAACGPRQESGAGGGGPSNREGRKAGSNRTERGA